MKVTCHHPASAYGHPVILDDEGNVMDEAEGVKEFRRRRDLSVQAFAELCNVSKRTAEQWGPNRPVKTSALNVMAMMLEQEECDAAKS